MSLREEIFKIVYTEDLDNIDLVWHTYSDKRVDMIIQAFEKRIDTLYPKVLDKTSFQTLGIIKEMLK